MRKIASVTAIALGVLVYCWPMFTVQGSREMSGFPSWFLGGGLVVIGVYTLAADHLSRAAGFGAVLILFSLMAFAISFNVLPVGGSWGFTRTAPAWDFDRFGAIFASIIGVAGVACMFVRDSGRTPRPEAQP